MQIFWDKIWDVDLILFCNWREITAVFLTLSTAFIINYPRIKQSAMEGLKSCTTPVHFPLSFWVPHDTHTDLVGCLFKHGMPCHQVSYCNTRITVCSSHWSLNNIHWVGTTSTLPHFPVQEMRAHEAKFSFLFSPCLRM